LLTPLDIHNKEFKRGFRGYDIDEVDEFLDEVIKDFESLYKENLELKEEIRKQQEHLSRYKETEDALQNTMLLAQKVLEESKRNAEKEAELVLWEARKKAEQIISSAHDQVTEKLKKVEQLKAVEKQLKARLKSFLSAQLEMLESSVLDVEQVQDSLGREEVICDPVEDNRD